MRTNVCLRCCFVLSHKGISFLWYGKIDFCLLTAFLLLLGIGCLWVLGPSFLCVGSLNWHFLPLIFLMVMSPQTCFLLDRVPCKGQTSSALSLISFLLSSSSGILWWTRSQSCLCTSPCCETQSFPEGRCPSSTREFFPCLYVYSLCLMWIQELSLLNFDFCFKLYIGFEACPLAWPFCSPGSKCLILLHVDICSPLYTVWEYWAICGDVYLQDSRLFQ